MILPEDIPKLESPFVRETINGRYIVTSKIVSGYEWVFDDSTVIASEKLDGTDVSVVVEGGNITSIWNREMRVRLFDINQRPVIEALLESNQRRYLELPDGQWFGEAVGPSLRRSYGLKQNVWLPFKTLVWKIPSDGSMPFCAYTSWNRYPKTFESISSWFKNDLFSLFMANSSGDFKKFIQNKNNPDYFAEGIVFVQPSTGKMAKLRRDMFDWYVGKGHKE